MKKVLLTMVLMLVAMVSASAKDVTYKFSDYTTLWPDLGEIPTGGYISIKAGQTLAIDDVSLTCVKYGSSSYPARLMSTTIATVPSVHYRIYALSQMKISSSAEAIKKLVFRFTCTTTAIINQNNIFSSGGKMTVSARGEDGYYTGTWEGDGTQQDITISLKGSAATQYLSLESIVVTTQAIAAVKSPKFSPNGGTFYQGLNTPGIVKLVSQTAGSTLKYKIGEGEYVDYDDSKGISITESCTVAAKAVLGEDESEEVTADFVVVDNVTECASAEEANACEAGAIVKINAPLTVIGWDKWLKKLICYDGKQAIFVDYTSQIAAGSTLAEGIGGEMKSGALVYDKYLDAIESTVAITDGYPNATPVEVTASQASGMAFGSYVKIKAATAYVANAATGDMTITDETGTISCNDALGIVPTANDDTKYIISAVMAADNKYVPVMIEKDESSAIDAIGEDAAPAVIYNLQGVKVAGTPAPGVYIKSQGGVTTKVIVK